MQLRYADDENMHQCASCGRSDCRDTYHRIYTRYHERLTQLLAQPEADPQEIWFMMFMISALGRRSEMMKEKAS